VSESKEIGKSVPNLAPRNADGESVERTPLFRSREDLIIKVFHAGDDDEPFICAVNGEVSRDGLGAIEEELSSDDHEFLCGPGEYTYEATWNDGQYDDMGRCEFRPCWELTEIAFEKPDWMSLSHEPEKAAPPSAEPCIDCGSTSCAFKHNCFPF
jgi:hypothetical protein